MVSNLKAFCFLLKNTFTWELKWTQTGMRFYYGWKSHSVFSQLFTFVHMKWGKMKLKPVWMSYWSFWPKWNFRPAWNFHANNLPKAKWISSVMLDITFNTHVHLKQSFWQKWNFISDDKIYVSTTRNEMPMHFHQNIG